MERLKTWLSFDGRLSRVGYWRLYLEIVIAGAVVWGVGLMASIYVGGWAAILFLPFLLILVASYAMVVRRLHDRNRSGWWSLLYFFGPGILMSLVDAKATQAGAVLVGLAAILAAWVIIIWGIVEIGFRRGTVGANRFGDPPARPA